jgi:hypothetical protein
LPRFHEFEELAGLMLRQAFAGGPAHTAKRLAKIVADFAVMLGARPLTGFANA